MAKASQWQTYVGSLADVLSRLEATTKEGGVVEPDEAFGTWHKATLAVRERRSTVYFIGNGASASMASHFSADLAKTCRLHTQTFFDPSLITALANDVGYEQVFAEPLRDRGRPGDMLVAISSSGESPNVLRAVECGRGLGMTIITLTARNPGNPLRARGDISLFVPAEAPGLAETAHAAVLHRWIDDVQCGDRSPA